MQHTVKEWTPEEVAMLTKGITKFPPGTVNRWKVIADFVQSKNQKEVIQKAKEIQEKQAWDVEAKRQAEVEKKELQEKIKKEAQEKVKRDLAEEKKASKNEPTANANVWSQEQ
jgi:DnaJ homolog subfamily C member 2